VGQQRNLKNKTSILDEQLTNLAMFLEIKLKSPKGICRTCAIRISPLLFNVIERLLIDHTPGYFKPVCWLSHFVQIKNCIKDKTPGKKYTAY